jgi:hypothetical protein
MWGFKTLEPKEPRPTAILVRLPEGMVVLEILQGKQILISSSYPHVSVRKPRKAVYNP